MLPNHVPNEILMNRQEAAQYLGVSPSTLANWACTQKYKIKSFRVGRSIRYRKRDLDDFVQSGEVD